MTTAELVIGIAGFLIGVLIGIRISPGLDYKSLGPCECGNRWPGMMELSRNADRFYAVACGVCKREIPFCNTAQEAIRMWNKRS